MDRIGASVAGQPTNQQYDYGRSKHGHLIGDVNESVDKILQMQELLRLTRFSAHMDVGSPDHAKMMKAIELYGTQIMPQVKSIGKNKEIGRVRAKCKRLAFFVFLRCGPTFYRVLALSS